MVSPESRQRLEETGMPELNAQDEPGSLTMFEPDEGIAADGLSEGPANIDNPVEWYLHLAYQRPLLTAEGEADCARRYNVGRQAQSGLDNASSLSREERGQLQHLAEDGQLAKNTLLLSNIRLVISIAKHHRGRGLPLADLISSGNIGLLKAIDRFNIELGFRFSTYASWWIKQSITRTIANEGRTIRIPVHMNQWLQSYLKAHSQLMQELGRDPSLDELARELNLTPSALVERTESLSQPISLNSPAYPSNQDTDEEGAFIEDSVSQIPTASEENEIIRTAHFVLSFLDERPRLMLKLRFGLFDGQAYTLKKIGTRFGLTRERVRQLIEGALEELKARPDLKKEVESLLD